MPFTVQDLDSICDGVLPAVREGIRNQLAPLAERVKSIEDRADSFDGKALGAEITSAFKAYVDKKVGSLTEKIAALETTCELLENRSLSFGGVYSRGVDYQRNALVLHRGVLWLAIHPNRGLAPDEHHETWCLILKHESRLATSMSSSRPTDIAALKGRGSAA